MLFFFENLFRKFEFQKKIRRFIFWDWLWKKPHVMLFNPHPSAPLKRSNFLLCRLLPNIPKVYEQQKIGFEKDIKSFLSLYPPLSSSFSGAVQFFRFLLGSGGPCHILGQFHFIYGEFALIKFRFITLKDHICMF